jgi:O-acetyl-ADP-ribose deacetylase (regulator of RNase III)
MRTKMIEYVRGDLLKAFEQEDINVMAHQCNCFNVMGAGIAKQIANRWPEVKAADAATTPGDISKLGNFTHAWVEDKVVFNLYGQFRFGRGMYTDYFALGAAMEKMAAWLNTNYVADRVIIGFPKIGCGFGGGDWSTISKMIENVFSKYKVYVYET